MGMKADGGGNFRGGGGRAAPRAKQAASKKPNAYRGPSHGALELEPNDYVRLHECMTQPKKPTPVLKAGMAVLRSLRKKAA